MASLSLENVPGAGVSILCCSDNHTTSSSLHAWMVLTAGSLHVNASITSRRDAGIFTKRCSAIFYSQSQVCLQTSVYNLPLSINFLKHPSNHFFLEQLNHPFLVLKAPSADDLQTLPNQA